MNTRARVFILPGVSVAEVLVEPNSVFGIQQSDGLWTLGQILDCPSPNFCSVVLFKQRVESLPVEESIDLEVFDRLSVISVTNEQIQDADWPVFAYCPLVVPQAEWPYEETRSRGWVGLKTHGSGLVNRFLEAYWGLRAWDEMHDPNYYEAYLVAGVSVPSHVIRQK